MKYMGKIIVYFCIVPLIFFFGLNLNRITTNKPSPAQLVLRPEGAKAYSENNRTRQKLLLEMRQGGWLPADYSEWFVSPNGSLAGTGRIDSPVDLETALAGKSKTLSIKPGDIIWLRGGTYRGSYTVRIGGSQKRPIHIRQYPGEQAILDKSSASREIGTLNVRNSYVWFWDFEVANSFDNRRRLDPVGKLNPWRGSGINVWAANTKYINLVIHDNGHGIGVWNEEGETEIYGCVIFNNGNNKKEHGIYAHNKTGTQRIENNVIFNNAGYGLHIYANSDKRSIEGFDIDSNSIFGNGSLMNEDQVADQILVGGVVGVAAGRIRLRGNVVYTNPEAPGGKSRGIRLGYRHKENADVALRDNLVIGKIPLKILWWNSVEVCRNTIVSDGRGIEIETPANPDLSKYRFAQNKIVSNGKIDRDFILNGKTTAFGSWLKSINDRGCSGADVPATLKQNLPIVNPNKYDKSLAFVTLYGNDGAEDVRVDLNGFLKTGKTFFIWDAQNYPGEPILTGVYQEKPVRLPLTGRKVRPPVGATEKIPVHTGRDFSVFIVRTTE